MMVRTIILTTLFIFIYSISAFTQAEENHDSHENSYQKLQNFYKESISKNNRYVNGYLYSETFPGSRGNPFFQSETWYQGDLFMDERFYEDLAIRYDLYRDQLLFNHIHPTGSYIVVLNIKRIESFSIDGHRFSKLPAPGHSSVGIKEGYYELLAEGRASFYVKWIKRLEDPTPESMGEFSLFKEWYILNNGEFRKVSGKSGFFKSLEDHEKEIRSYIRENRIVIKTGNELDLKRIVDYYNHLEP